MNLSTQQIKALAESITKEVNDKNSKKYDQACKLAAQKKEEFIMSKVNANPTLKEMWKAASSSTYCPIKDGIEKYLKKKYKAQFASKDFANPTCKERVWSENIKNDLVLMTIDVEDMKELKALISKKYGV